LPLRKAWVRFKTSPGAGLRRLLRIIGNRNGLSNLADVLSISSRISRNYARYDSATRDAVIRNAPSLKERLNELRHRPTISILMPVFNAEEIWLRLAIESVRRQIYPSWELCIADDASTRDHVMPILSEYSELDPRIKVVFREVNGHISAALNSALALASGEFVAFLDQDDELSPDALYEVVGLLDDHPEADVIYTDEDRLELDGRHVEPFFKPDWSPNLLLSINYITHLAIIRRRLLQIVGGFRDEFIGSQDFDLFLRVVEKTNHIFHVPKVLYSWRKLPTSAALISDVKPYAPDASRRAVIEATQRRGLAAEVSPGSYAPFLRLRYRIEGRARVSVVMAISANESPRRTLQPLRDSLPGSDNLTEIVAVMDPEIFEDSTRQGQIPGVKLVRAPAPPGSLSENLAAGAAEASGDYLTFLNPVAVPLQSDWLAAMIEYAQMANIGCVGAKLVDRRGRIIHAGLALGMRGTVGNPSRGLADVPHVIFYLNLKDTPREVSAVSIDCLMIDRVKFTEVDGFRTELRSHYFDTDLCLRLSGRGYTNIYTPHAKLSVVAGRSRTDGAADGQLLEQDGERLRDLWGTALLSDPFYNSNLARHGHDLSLNPPVVPANAPPAKPLANG